MSLCSSSWALPDVFENPPQNLNLASTHNFAVWPYVGSVAFADAWHPLSFSQIKLLPTTREMGPALAKIFSLYGKPPILNAGADFVL
jgi:hypothetical protein